MFPTFGNVSPLISWSRYAPVRVVWLSSKAPPRAGIVCAFPSWFVSVTGPNHLREKLGDKTFAHGNAEGPAGTLPTL
jgi:hypothetical protein